MWGDKPCQAFEKVHSCFNVNPDAEITVEANPGTINREKLDVLKSAGVNRLSLDPVLQ